jgi:hypothetical protein
MTLVTSRRRLDKGNVFLHLDFQQIIGFLSSKSLSLAMYSVWSCFLDWTYEFAWEMEELRKFLVLINDGVIVRHRFEVKVDTGVRRTLRRITVFHDNQAIADSLNGKYCWVELLGLCLLFLVFFAFCEFFVKCFKNKK